jgi:hypothetical protein
MAVLLSQGSKQDPGKEVKRWITPEREVAIRGCILSAVDEYRSKYSELRHKHCGRTDASIIHNLMVWNIKHRFENDPEVRCKTK